MHTFHDETHRLCHHNFIITKCCADRKKDNVLKDMQFVGLLWGNIHTDRHTDNKKLPLLSGDNFGKYGSITAIGR